MKKKIIHITKKGVKGSWWNKYVDNYFMCIPNENGWTVEYLSNVYSEKVSNIGSGEFLPREFGLVFLTIDIELESKFTDWAKARK